MTVMSRSIRPALISALMLFPGATFACPDGARCVSAPETSAPVIGPGEVLTPGSFNMLVNAEYYGLPQASDGTWYVTVDRRVYRIRPGTYEVIEDVTRMTNRAFW